MKLEVYGSGTEAVDSGYQRRLAQSVPFYYGWFVLAAASLNSYSSRPLMAATTLSVFVVPMTEHFGWSRGLFSGALSLGGLFAVAISPFIGRLIDRYGAGIVVAAAAGLMGACAVGLSAISHAWMFYALYVPGRMLFASPLELGTATAVSNWFVRRRPLALAIFGATQGTGLAAMPPIAQAMISGWDWQTAWLSLGIFTISVGVIPSLFMVRRPEDMGLEADPGPSLSPRSASGSLAGTSVVRRPRGDAGAETNFTVRDALRTRAFWVLAVFSAFGFMAQGGVIVHQVPHYINEGLDPATSAVIASAFALSQVFGGFVWANSASRVPLRFLLAGAGLCVALGAVGTGASSTFVWGMLAAAALGIGIGGLHLLLRLAWADYYGRDYLGSIRGLTLPIQISGQAVGPVISGFMFDATGNYQAPFFIFGIGVALAALMVVAAVPPRRPASVGPENRGNG